MKYLFFLTVIFLSCKPDSSDLFSDGVERGELNEALNEISGLVASRTNDGFLWGINDSGNSASVYLIDFKGGTKHRYDLPGVKNRDWEDISISPGSDGRKPQIYVADIGDNAGKYAYKYLYRFDEPEYNVSPDKIAQFDTIVVDLEGDQFDAEAIAIDPVNGDLFLFSKRLEINNVFKITKSELASQDTVALNKVGEIKYLNIVAADFSLDGDELLVKTYNEILYWRRSESETVEQMLQRKPALLRYKPEPQGESVAWTSDGSGFFTVSEGRDKKSAPLYFYTRNSTK